MIDNELSMLLAKALAGVKGGEQGNMTQAFIQGFGDQDPNSAMQRVRSMPQQQETVQTVQAPVRFSDPDAPQPSKPSPYAPANGPVNLGNSGKPSKLLGGIPADTSPELYNHMSAVEQQYGLPAGLLKSVADKGEKSGSNATSPVGAAGRFQFMPATWKQYGGDTNPRDPFASTNAAGKMFSDLLKQYNGNVAAAVAHYNGGTRQGRLVAQGKEPTFTETRNYVQRVLA